MLTNYTIEEPRLGQFTVSLNGRLTAQGFTDQESALHAVWVSEGKPVSARFDAIGGLVYRIELSPTTTDDNK